ncbi:MAG TPA: hypothetical protein PLO24_03935 [Bacteroidales bacterium]|nr:hypothetical protein [Bacteroidales bacterium]HOS71237.1 hypothetical protein [Bacteroidales bacterium]HQH24335.1 hypothetical protein [Bacteroidales bacterium]HQJ81570.1 hypothetical protein [Bacteroidales bacterium]
MKNKILIRLFSLMAIISVMAACEKSPIEKAQDAYDATKVVPVVLGFKKGPVKVLQTFSYEYEVSYYRAGSTWSWSAVDATISSVTPDTRGVNVLFDKLPASGKAQIKVVETTSGGVKSPEKVIEVTVSPFCPLPVSGFVGTWTGKDVADDFEYSVTVTASLSDGKILLEGFGTDIIEEEAFWNEAVVEGGTCLVTINPDGTLVIPEQFFLDTDETEGYKIKGEGTWDNCGPKPTLEIKYDIWYPDPDDNFWIADEYFGEPLTLTLTLAGDDDGNGG